MGGAGCLDSRTHTAICPSCGFGPMDWCGIRVPSSTKKPASRRLVAVDYMLKCSRCGTRTFVAHLPDGFMPKMGESGG